MQSNGSHGRDFPVFLFSEFQSTLDCFRNGNALRKGKANRGVNADPALSGFLDLQAVSCRNVFCLAFRAILSEEPLDRLGNSRFRY